MSKASSSSKKPPKSTSTSKTNKTKQGNAHKQRNANENDIIESESESPSTSDLLSKIARLETELAKESAYRNHAQLERDKTLAFWEISKRALRRSESIGREHERALEEVETDANTRERAMTQRLKHEREQCEDTLRKMQEETSEAIRAAKRRFECRVEEMWNDARKDEMKRRETDARRRDDAHAREMEREKELAKLRQEFEEKREKDRECWARREKMRIDHAEQMLADAIERRETRTEMRMRALAKESDWRAKETEAYYRGLKDAAERETMEMAAKVAAFERRARAAEMEATRAKAKANVCTEAKAADAFSEKGKVSGRRMLRASSSPAADDDDKRRVEQRRLAFLERSRKTSEEKREQAEKNLERVTQRLETVALENAELRAVVACLRERDGERAVVASLGPSSTTGSRTMRRVVAA